MSYRPPPGKSPLYREPAKAPPAEEKPPPKRKPKPSEASDS